MKDNAKTKRNFSRSLMFAVIVLVMCMALIVSGCSKTDNEAEYRKDIQTALDSYSKAFEAYNTNLVAKFGSVDVSTPLTKENISDMQALAAKLDTDAGKALDTLTNLQAPDKFKKEQEQIASYAKEMKRVTVPAVSTPLKELKEGQTLKEFVGVSQPSDSDAARIKRLSVDFSAALAKIGVKEPEATSGESSSK